MTASSLNAVTQVGRSSKIASFAPWFSRIVMIPPVVIMVLIATRYFANPAHAASPTGVVLSTPEALTDTRVVGGLTLTIAFAIATSIFSFRTLRAGHATVMALMAFVLVARMYGFAHDGTTLTMGTQMTKTVGEILFLVLNSVAFAVQTYVLRQNRVRP